MKVLIGYLICLVYGTNQWRLPLRSKLVHPQEINTVECFWHFQCTGRDSNQHYKFLPLTRSVNKYLATILVADTTVNKKEFCVDWFNFAELANGRNLRNEVAVDVFKTLKWTSGETNKTLRSHKYADYRCKQVGFK